MVKTVPVKALGRDAVVAVSGRHTASVVPAVLGCAQAASPASARAAPARAAAIGRLRAKERCDNFNLLLSQHGRRSRILKEFLTAGALGVVLAGAPAAGADQPRWFPDRPVAWAEHDDMNMSTTPATNDLQDLDATLFLRDSLKGEIDRILSLEGRTPALDVNALDEVPCSTWFCPRNHLHPMTPEEVAAGPPAAAPVLPLKIVKGKDDGTAPGFQVVDATGKKFMLKLDPAGHLGLSTGGEIVGYRFFHAAGYYVPGAFHADVREEDLALDPKATYKLFGVEKRPLTRARVHLVLRSAARLPDGRLRAVAVPWIEHTVGGFDLQGRRADDPNDRIPHERRRSLRANRVLFAWLAVLDPSSINTLDSVVVEDGRRFLRHYHFDFGASLGSATTHPQSPAQQGEFLIEVGRSLRALFSFGLYHRTFEDQRAEWRWLVAEYPAIGYLPAESFEPDEYRTDRKLPTHVRMTDRDAYWGAKVVTSFTDAQIEAVVAAAALPAPAAAYAIHALEVRRDIIGRRYLRAMAAVEDPSPSPDGQRVCFEDLAIARGYVAPAEARYRIDVGDGLGRRLYVGRRPADGPRACAPIAPEAAGTGYRVVSIATELASAGAGGESVVTKASRIHLRWRERERRFVVVGLERDE
ncbi:MAG TPA: hypothetical protein VHL80_12670 [Polyangia bacterium]|nr:hypothetical protein [Polyangia bacterium]